VCGDGATQLGCGEECDDGNTESGDGCSDTCTSEFGSACGPTPAADCARPVAAGKSSVLIKIGSTEKSDGIGWKWGRGATTPKNDFGVPSIDTSYALCVYAGGARVASMSIPAGGVCRGRPCWSESTSGFTYKNADAAPQGVTKLTLRQGLEPGKAKIGLKGKGGPLPLPDLPLALPVVVQLQNGIGKCWEGVYSAPAQRNVDTQFKDSSD
jgi:cysteine-rich repeat protein